MARRLTYACVHPYLSAIQKILLFPAQNPSTCYSSTANQSRRTRSSHVLFIHSSILKAHNTCEAKFIANTNQLISKMKFSMLAIAGAALAAGVEGFSTTSISAVRKVSLHSVLCWWSVWMKLRWLIDEGTIIESILEDRMLPLLLRSRGQDMSYS